MKNRARRLKRMDLKIRLAVLGLYGVLTLCVVYVTRGSADAGNHVGGNEKEDVGNVCTVFHNTDAPLPEEDMFKMLVLRARTEYQSWDILTGADRSVVHLDPEFRISAIRTEAIYMFVRKRMLR